MEGEETHTAVCQFYHMGKIPFRSQTKLGDQPSPPTSLAH